ncbi:MAG: 2-hydroxychromene-2-carboxylate isomerase [Dongiaceae bacterium]
MTRSINFFFDFVSPYGWFAAERIGALAHRHGRTVRWRPILLKVTVMQAMGLPPLLETPLKGAYIMRDAARSARFYGLPWRPPAAISFSSVAAARAVTWANSQTGLNVEALVLALYRRAWTQAGDISTPEAVAAVASSVGFDRDQVLDALGRPEVKEALRVAVAAALDQGVFGSPFIVVDGEPFWGADRLNMVEHWLETMVSTHDCNAA